ncbi:Metal ion ABC transport systems, permease components [Alteracholeplasma palmae J233]|uniref:Metal ion ABC transport systems, permease components n=1 Tax=Alteracholeplasma palmae (strain ATCC 49389 / J233) TaxID=1318466 RepID=U4KRH7_ALTPJ|nr:metal ABC transporter permease [Alteracholeplasma palmae]CCV64176.1 Metal ion ABC transport systems, permease components [Alteracholeplasma palmae J233]
MFNFLTQDFMIRALLLALSLSAAASLLSPFLVLNKQAMIADGLSHVAFTGIIFGLLFSNQAFYIAIPFTVLASIFITYLGNIKMIDHDSAIGVISTFTLAVGLIVVSLTDGFNRDIESLLTGAILSSSSVDVWISFAILIITGAFITFFYRSLLSLTYDESYAKFSKVKSTFLKYCLSALTGLFIVVGIRTVGMLLISTFIIFPALIASQISRSFKQTILISLLVSVVSVFLSIWISYELDTPTGSTIVVFYTLVLALAIIYRRFFKKN